MARIRSKGSNGVRIFSSWREPQKPCGSFLLSLSVLRVRRTFEQKAFAPRDLLTKNGSALAGGCRELKIIRFDAQSCPAIVERSMILAELVRVEQARLSNFASGRDRYLL
jgi:hypothetical protein